MLLNRIGGKAKEPDAGRSGQRLRGAAAFAVKYREAEAACGLLQEETRMAPGQLAGWYMSHVLRTQKEAAWWQANAAYLVQPWFIYEYACQNGVIQRAEREEAPLPACFVIAPEEVRREGCIRLRVERMAVQPAWGRVCLAYEQADKAYHWVARTHHYQSQEDEYRLTVREADGNVEDRAVEIATVLLKQGYRVCVGEPLLKERILAEDFEAAYPYWVTEGSAVDRLELRYPRDRELHSHVYRAGGRWNGSAVEISISSSHLLDDLIRLYGFRITKGARRRMDAWQETLAQATIYRPRKRKGNREALNMTDRFKEMMAQKVRIIDDLVDGDE